MQKAENLAAETQAEFKDLVMSFEHGVKSDVTKWKKN